MQRQSEVDRRVPLNIRSDDGWVDGRERKEGEEKDRKSFAEWSSQLINKCKERKV